MTPNFWRGKHVFLTGHTGFKGSWMVAVLQRLGAKVSGYALAPNTTPSLFELLQLKETLAHHCEADIRDAADLSAAIKQASPEIVIHMAAQPLVRHSYREPVETYATNVMGTVHVLEAFRHCETAKVCVNVTTDKVYENHELNSAFTEDQPLGGYDPYSNSKACSELVTSAYRQSFCHPDDYAQHGKAIASARAGNVIGGGDWSEDRLVPDLIMGFINQQPIEIRNPNAIRPWQHVLEPISGYLTLVEKLWQAPKEYAQAWNFGPEIEDCVSVSLLADKLVQRWDAKASWILDETQQVHEAHFLRLAIQKAKTQLAWQPQWSLDVTLDKVTDWYQAWHTQKNLVELTQQQITDYFQLDGR